MVAIEFAASVTSVVGGMGARRGRQNIFMTFSGEEVRDVLRPSFRNRHQKLLAEHSPENAGERRPMKVSERGV